MSDLNRHVMRLLCSYKRWTGKDLIPPPLDAESACLTLKTAPFVLVSHGVEEDPILNYGNDLALQLWEMDWKRFTQTPSRLTAEAPNREERARLLDQVSRFGYIEDYSGVRISASGRRFIIEKAVVWNVMDESEKYCGQAATFSQWTPLNEEKP